MFHSSSFPVSVPVPSRLAACALIVGFPLSLAGVAGAQSGFGAQQVITNDAVGANHVYATDLDGDGDADVLSASHLDDKIAWYENLGGGVFGAQQVITNAAAGATSVYATDLDGDGDADVLSASFIDDKIAWYENLGGGAFGAQQVITTALFGAVSVYATDLDGDGDADVLSASQWDDKIAWYENLGGGAFGGQQVITAVADADAACSVYATDLDGDGDADVLSASFIDDKIAWYENLGGGAFGPQQVITTAANAASQVYATDLDGDGDADVLSASQADDKIAWYENLGGGVFGVQQVITNAAAGAYSVYATDLDGDGDADVLSASYRCPGVSVCDEKIAWYENLGGGAFGPQQVITTAVVKPIWVYATDLDGDGDADVLSASHDGSFGSFFDHKIAWFENLGSGGPITAFCDPGNVNSTGGPVALTGTLGVSGLHMEADGGPLGQFGFFLVSAGAHAGAPVSDGLLCLGSPIGRYNSVAGGVRNSIGQFQGAGVLVNLVGTSSVGTGFDVPAALPSPPGGTIVGGSTWMFQLWYRDGPNSNFSNGLEVNF